MSSRWRTLTGLIGPVYLPNMASTIAWGMLIPTLPLYLAERGISIEMTGTILGATGLGALIGGLPGGSLNTRAGEYAALVVGLTGIAASTALLGVTDTALVLIVLRMIFGASFLVARLSRQTWVTRNVALDLRGRAMAVFGGSTRLSLFIGPFLGGVLAEWVGYSATFGVAAGLTIIGVVPPWLGRRHDVESPAPEPVAQRGVLRAIRVHRRMLARAAIVPLLVMVIREGRLVLVPLVADDLELSVAAVGAVVSVSSAADLLLFPVAGSLMDRFGRLWSMIPALGMIAAGLVALGFAAASGSVAAVIAAGVLVGLGNGLSAGSMLTLGADLAPADDTSAFLAAVATSQESGRFLGALGVGLVAGGTSLATASFVYGALAVLTILTVFRVVGESSRIAAASREA